MFVSEEELSIQIAQVYRVEVDNVYFSIAGLDQIFQEFATNATCANK